MMQKKKEISAKEDYVKVLGRTLMKDGIRYLSYSCSAIEFEFTGSKVEAVLCTNTPIPEKDFRVWAAVFVNNDEVPVKRFPLDQEETLYSLYESDGPKQTKIRLVKYSEAFTGVMGVKSIIVDSESTPVPTAKKERKLEFVGDSITCGYGNEGIFNVDDFKTSQENPWEAYATKTARAIDADYHLVSWSGIGIISNYTEEDKPDQSWLMPNLYPYTDKQGDLTLKSTEIEEWENQRFIPDCIIINLGTNDCSYTKGIKERVEAFGEAYYQFVKQIRSKNPTSKILCTLGAMGQDLYPEIERQVKRLNLEGEESVYSMPFDVQSEEDGIGVYWHPTLTTHAKMTKKLEAKIREIMNW